MTTPDANHITIKTLTATPKYRCVTIKVRHRPLAIFAMLAIVVFSAVPIRARADIHDARSTALQSKVEYIDARPHHQIEETLLRHTAGPYVRSKADLRAAR